MTLMMMNCLCSSAFSCLPSGVPHHFHHVCVDLLADHLHPAHEPPEGGECARLRRSLVAGWDDEAWLEAQM